MLTAKQKKALRLMFKMTDQEVMAELGVQPETMAKWKKDPDFLTALADEEREARVAVSRMATEASLQAAKNLHTQVSTGKDAKLSLEILKASGAFAEREESNDDAFGAIVRRSLDEADSE